MGIQIVQISSAFATNSVADDTGVDLAAAAQLEAGPVFPNVGSGNAVLIIEIDAGSTPGAYDILLEESADDSTYTAVDNGAIDEATVGTTVYRNVTISERYVRMAVTEATANAGTVSAWLLSA